MVEPWLGSNRSVRLAYALVSGTILGALGAAGQCVWIMSRSDKYTQGSMSLVHAVALLSLCWVELACMVLGVATFLATRIAKARRKTLRTRPWRLWCVLPIVAVGTWAFLFSWLIGPRGPWSAVLQWFNVYDFALALLCVPVSIVAGAVLSWLATAGWTRGSSLRFACAFVVVAFFIAGSPLFERVATAAKWMRSRPSPDRWRGAPSQIKGVVFILIDTLRADHVSCLDASNVRTPRIDRLARQGVLFAQAISQAPWTCPSLGSIMTSQYPSVHGAGEAKQALTSSLPTLGEILSRARWHTAAFVTNDLLAPGVGFSRGFQRYEMRPRLRPRAWTGSAREIRLAWPLRMFALPDEGIHHDCAACIDRPAVERTTRWLRTRASAPFFLWLHLMAVHDYADYYAVRLDAGRQPKPIIPNVPFTGPPSALRAIPAEKAVDDLSLEELHTRYKRNIVFDDALLGVLFDTLRELGIFDQTLVILTADHGEEFEEHGTRQHGHTLYDELLRVPLILSCPSALPKGIRITQQVRLIDLLPTILDVAGVSTNASFCGKSMLSLLRRRNQEERPAFSEFDFDHKFESVRTESYKLITHLADQSFELYDLAHDPGEHLNIAAGSPRVLASMRELYVGWRTAVRSGRGAVQPSRAQIDDDLKARMEALGYVVGEDGRVRSRKKSKRGERGGQAPKSP